MASTLLNNIRTYQKFDGDSTDATSNGNNGTDTNITYVTGKIGQAARLNGSTSKVDVGTLGTFGSNLATGFSFTTIFKTTATGIMQLAGGRQSSGGERLDIEVNTGPSGAGTGRLKFNLHDNSASILRGGSNTDNGITDGNWHLLIVNFLPATNTFTCKLDNSTITMSYSVTGTPSNFGNLPFNMYIGAFNNIGSIFEPFNGDMDATAFWDRILTTTEETELWNSGNGIQYPFTAGYGNKVIGVTPSKVITVESANISKVIGV